MKPRVHSSLLLLFTLVIGMILGALVQSHLRSNRMKHFSMAHNEDRFIAVLEEAILPKDEEQAAQIHAILEATANRVIPAVHESRKFFRTEIEQMQASLDPLLDEEQKERLANRLRPPKRPHKKQD